MQKIVFISFFIVFLGCSNSHYNKFDNGTNKVSQTNSVNRDDGTSVIIENEEFSFDNGTNNYSQKVLDSLAKKDNTNNPNNKASRTKNKTKDYVKVKKDKPENSSSKENISNKKFNTSVSKNTNEKSPKNSSDSVNKNKEKSSKSETKIVSKTKVTPKSKEPFYYPVSNISLDNNNKSKENKNLKFTLRGEDSIFPAGKGIVIFSGDKGGIGKTLFVYHNNGYISIYYNLKKLNVNKGDYIKTLDSEIATASNSFNFELRKQTDNGIVKLNPKDYLQKRVN